MEITAEQATIFLPSTVQRSPITIYSWRSTIWRSGHTLSERSAYSSVCQFHLRMPRFVLTDLNTRPETETYTLHTAKLILDQLDSFRSNDPLRPHPKPFRIIDLCSGTGCISLLLHAILAPHITDLAILGLDLSKRAVKLARQNTLYNVQRGLLHPRAMTEVIFDQTDILTLADKDDSDVKKFLHGIDLKGRTYNSGTPVDEFKCDVLISNPPYISQSCIMDGTTARSVYKYEPMMALVPPLPLATPPVYSNGNRHAELLDGDTFYPKLLNLSKRLRANITVLECGDRLQANRVLSMAQRVMKDMANAVVEIWPGGDEHCNSDGTRAVVIRNRN